MGAFRQQRLSRREVLVGSAGIILAAPSTAASAAESASPWASSSHSALRLLDGGTDGGGQLAALAIRLHPGFKTYWRHPGDSGVPPMVRFDGSVNLKRAELLFPAPLRFDDGAGGVSFGYRGDEVLLPIRVTPGDPSQPVLLKLQADYAVCEKLCVPASGAAELALHGKPTAHGEAVRRALAAVPQRVAPAAPGKLRVLGLAKTAEPQVFAVEVAHPEGPAPELFVEAPQPWFFETRPSEPAAAGRPARILVKAVERDRSADFVVLTLTLVAGREAIEVEAPLDIGLIAP